MDLLLLQGGVLRWHPHHTHILVEVSPHPLLLCQVEDQLHRANERGTRIWWKRLALEKLEAAVAEQPRLCLSLERSVTQGGLDRVRGLVAGLLRRWVLLSLSCYFYCLYLISLLPLSPLQADQKWQCPAGGGGEGRAGVPASGQVLLRLLGHCCSSFTDALKNKH